MQVKEILFLHGIFVIYTNFAKNLDLQKVRKNGVYLLEEVYTIYRPVTNMFGRIRDIKNIY